MSRLDEQSLRAHDITHISQGLWPRMHNMDQKATVIWPGPEMRQILCACPRVFWWFCLHFWWLLRFRAGAQKLAQKWCALPGSLKYSFTPSRALIFANKILSKNDQKICDFEPGQITVAKWSNYAYEESTSSKSTWKCVWISINIMKQFRKKNILTLWIRSY